jgi:hypothetical protein
MQENFIEKVILGTITREDIENELSENCTNEKGHYLCNSCAIYYINNREDTCEIDSSSPTLGKDMLNIILKHHNLPAPRLYKPKSKKQAVAYNRNKKKSVVLARLKEFSIDECYTCGAPTWMVRGWYNKENYFIFGDDFETEEAAFAFREMLHEMY